MFQNVPPDLSQCVFVIEQALSVRALQELMSRLPRVSTVENSVTPSCASPVSESFQQPETVREERWGRYWVMYRMLTSVISVFSRLSFFSILRRDLLSRSPGLESLGLANSLWRAESVRLAT